MTLTILACATIAHSRISKIDSSADHSLNGEAELLNVAADLICLTALDKDSRCVQAMHYADVYNVLIDAHGIRSSIEDHDTHQELTMQNDIEITCTPATEAKPCGRGNCGCNSCGCGSACLCGSTCD